jgi:hypothetical protein
VSKVSALEKEIRDTRNQLAEAVGSYELAEGVVARQAVEVNSLNKRVSDLLGENTRLEGVIGNRDARIRLLSQANATLQEQIDFSSESDGSNATVTVITGCDETANEQEEAVVGVEPVEENGSTTPSAIARIPNIRVDFDMQRSGFNVRGYTTTNPALAELTLTQLEPFIIDIAVTEDRSGTRQIVVSEQNNRLNLDIGEFAFSQRYDRERWYERVGFGATAAYNNRRALIGPTLYLETGRRLDVTGGPLWDASTGQTGGHVTLVFRPFRRNR